MDTGDEIGYIRHISMYIWFQIYYSIEVMTFEVWLEIKWLPISILTGTQQYSKKVEYKIQNTQNNVMQIRQYFLYVTSTQSKSEILSCNTEYR